MASLDVQVNVRSRLKGQARALADVIAKETERTARDVRDKSRALMKEPKTGRPYKGYIASAPGQAPAIRPVGFYPTGGELYAAITVFRGPGTSWYVFYSTDYAGFLEYGTRHMKPRPFVRPGTRKALTALRTRVPVVARYRLGAVPWR